MEKRNDHYRKKNNTRYNDKRDARSPEEEVENGAVVGRNAVRELLKSGRDIDKIFVQKGEREGSIVALVAEAVERKIPVIESEGVFECL